MPADSADQTSSTAPLILDPGPSNAARKEQFRVTVDVGRCCIWTTFTVVTLIFCAFVGLLSHPVLTKEHPHKTHLVDKESIDNGADRVVKPLIDENQTFDIAATVFVRDAQQELADNEYGRLKEIPLFSEVVFQDRQFGDKEQTTVVNLKIPLDVFKQETLFNYDIRASFVLIPKSPSPLDRLKEHTSWMKQWAKDEKASPRRSWPFPLSQHEHTVEGSPSKTDIATDQMSVTLPLLQFYGVAGSCDDGETSRSQSIEKDFDWSWDQSRGLLVSTVGRAALHAHPYLVTKTHLRVVQDTEHYRKDKFIDTQTGLPRRFCKLAASGDTSAEYHHCERRFHTNGVFETLFELEASDEGGEKRSEWAYGPFLATVQSAAGPKDLIPLPVQRGSCKPSLGAKYPKIGDFPQSIDVQWKISFAPVSAQNQFAVELLHNLAVASGNDFNHTHGDWTQARNQDRVDMFNGLIGHSHAEETHAWRRFVFVGIRALLWLPELFIFVDYWYTRRSTYGISITASLSLGLNTAVRALEQSWNGPLSIIERVLTFACAGLILSKIVRLRVSKRPGKWVPSVAFATASHRERYSQRLDVSWKIYGPIYLALVLLYATFNPHNIILAPSAFTTPDPTIPSSLSAYSYVLIALIAPAPLFSLLAQLFLNQRLRVFAGEHKLGLVLGAVSFLLRYAEYVERLVGKTHGKGERVTVDGVLMGVGILVGLWQAWVFSSVDQDEEDEKE